MDTNFEHYKVFYYVAKYENLTKGASVLKTSQPAVTRTIHSLENGTIYISATETALHCYLFEAVRDFNILYPNVHFKILNNSTTDSVNALKEGKVDLAVVSATLQVAAPLKMKIVKKYRDILIGGNFEQHGLQFSPDVELATTDMILPAVRYNLGIGFIPREFAQDDLESGKVFEIQVKEALPERNILVIHDTEYPQSIASKAFQKFLTEREAEKTK